MSRRGKVRFQKTKLLGLPHWITVYGICGTCGIRTTFSVKPGTTVGGWVCSCCDEYVRCDNNYIAPSYN